MFSRTLRNLRSAGSLFALALLAFAVVALLLLRRTSARDAPDAHRLEVA